MNKEIKGCGEVALNVWDGEEYIEIKCGETFSGKLRLCKECWEKCWRGGASKTSKEKAR